MYIDQPMVNAYLEKDNISKKTELYHKSLEYILDKYDKDFRNHPIALTKQYLNLAVDSIKRKALKSFFKYLYCVLKQGLKPLSILVTRNIFNLGYK